MMPSSATSAEHEELAPEQAMRAADTRASTGTTTATVPYENSFSTSPIGSATNMPSNADDAACRRRSARVTNAAPASVSSDSA